MNGIRFLNDGWEIKCGKYVIPSSVPGDITIDFYKQGLISNPYIAENYKDAEWISRSNYEYFKEFDIDEKQIQSDVVNIVFKGIDLFAEIFINDVSLGKTKNAFLLYKFDIKKYVRVGKNKLVVKFKSTLAEMDKIDTTGYVSIFNLPRMFVRKPQCHFGWDWAPKICASGIIDECYIECKNKYQIEDVQIIADDRGNLRFHTLLNYDNKPLFGPDDKVLLQGEEPKDDKLVYYVSKTPFGNEFDRFEVPMMGKKNYLAKRFDNVELWWPVGYGEANLYNYKIELVRDGKIMDSREGRFGFRSVKLIEDAKDNNSIGLDFYINGKKIYLKGSNWVPPECFTGVMQDEKYRKMIKLAKDMNANILRVWGGGSYEKDIFFDICDEEGIVVWQDFALACADIPEENPEFLNNFLDEVRYQIKRLRNHPSLIYWCGGNEKTGTYGNCITHGDYLVNCIIYGIVQDLDGTRPYRRQSPHSYTDVGNNPLSGDSHYGNGESVFVKNTYDEYRDDMASKVVPFASECAILGPSSEETLRKIFPKEHLWPMDDMWADRFMKNPYSTVLLDFPHRELLMAEKFYDSVNGLTDFIQKCMIAHAETMRAEAEYSRAHSDQTGAFLNWMFDDIWPSGTWATIDYYLEPKEVYYQLRRSFAPHLVSFWQDKNKKTHLFVSNQTNKRFSTSLEVSVKKLSGETFEKNKFNIQLDENGLFDTIIDFKESGYDVYLSAKYCDEGEEKNTIYSPTMFRFAKFDNKYSFDVEQLSPNKIKVKIHANSFIKSLFIHFDDNYKYCFSDNYLNIEKDSDKTIYIESENMIDANSIKFQAFVG